MRLSVSLPNRQIAAILFALVLGLYLSMVAPGLLDGDAGEFQFAAWCWGLAHPTGYPLYLLMGGAWQHGLARFGVEPAAALNAFSAVIGASAVGLLYGVMLCWLPGPSVLQRGAALFTALFFAVNPTFWSQNLIAEVYTLHVLLLLLILFFALTSRPPAFISLAFLLGLALTHHAMTLLFVPALLSTLWLVEPTWWRSGRRVGGMLLAGATPLLLYLYIPLRSTPGASPWYHQVLGDGPLTLYENTWPAFMAFISGRSISVGFEDWPTALEKLPQAWLLWRLNLTWIGLLLALLGLGWLVQQRNWPLLALTAGYALLQQIFNLFYAIGDILVYYIPLYLMASIWAGLGAYGLANWVAGLGLSVRPSDRAPAKRPQPVAPIGLILLVLLYLTPFALLRDYIPRLDQRQTSAARVQWESILAASPPDDAILVSNDRNEIVPLFYLQQVEGRAIGMAGLFPLLKPGAAFADIGATVETALARSGGRPVVLIKPMAGLEVKFALNPLTPPLVQVRGLASQGPPTQPVNAIFGPLRLDGYTWQAQNETVQIALQWSVQEQVAGDYTTTVQLFDAAGEKLSQSDQAPGGVYYPTSLWKVGERLVEHHTLAMPPGRQPAKLLIGMYSGAGFGQLAPALELVVYAQ
jgi:hypothetical protein